ncbi:MAG TPA: hypothetical protein VFE82_10620 [Ramlibacter sp.]|jgi:hypothetical protein|nr:hypothetical protein [Ramlibacter sp.]
MALELPILRIGLAGFSLDQQQLLAEAVARESAGSVDWEFGALTEADACCVNGARTQLLLDGTLRVGSGIPAGRSVQIDPAALERPIAYSLPLAPRNLVPELSFELEPDSIKAMLRRMVGSLKPLIAQFCLASQILEQESALGAGIYHVISVEGKLLAVVDLRGDVGVLANASPLELESAMWAPQPRRPDAVPGHFHRCSLSRLMWQYAQRTHRDLLPPRYRTELLYFRRTPRLPHRLLKDAHLRLLQALAREAARFADLEQRTGLGAPELARELAALYLVGAITSNPKRAASAPRRRAEALDSDLPSDRGAMPSGLNLDTHQVTIHARTADLTVPAPMVRD